MIYLDVKIMNSRHNSAPSAMFMLFTLGDLTLGNGLRLEGRLLHPLLRAHFLATRLRHTPDGVVLLQVLNASGHPCEKPPQTKLLCSAEETYFVRRRKYFSLRRFRTLLRSVFFTDYKILIASTFTAHKRYFSYFFHFPLHGAAAPSRPKRADLPHNGTHDERARRRCRCLALSSCVPDDCVTLPLSRFQACFRPPRPAFPRNRQDRP